MQIDRVPFRLRVLRNLTALLETISVADGYNFDLAGKVYRGIDEFGESDGLPLVSILEAPVPIDPALSPKGEAGSLNDWDLLIQGWCEEDHKNPTDNAHYLMADVKQILFKEAKKAGSEYPDVFGMGTAIDDMIVGQGVVRPADKTQDCANFWLRVTLKIIDDNTDPYV